MARKKEDVFSQKLNILDKIRLQMPTFSKTYNKVANYILENYNKAVFLTSFKMGQICGVSESSVIRFAGIIGYSGYSEMQQALQELIKSQITMTQRLQEFSANLEDDASILQQMMYKGIESLRTAAATVSEEDFNKTVKLLLNCQRVFLVASRSTYGIIYFFGYSLNWIRKEVYVIDCNDNNMDELLTVTKKDLVIAISMPRYPKSTVKALELAHSKGANIVAITDTITSPLTTYSQISLLVQTNMLSYLDNVIPVMPLITALLTAVGAADKKKTAERISMFEKYWEENDIYY